MTVHARILLFILAGYLAGAGWISQEIKEMLTTDPEIAMAVQAALAVVVTGAGYAWRWTATCFGWST